MNGVDAVRPSSAANIRSRWGWGSDRTSDFPEHAVETVCEIAHRPIRTAQRGHAVLAHPESAPRDAAARGGRVFDVPVQEFLVDEPVEGGVQRPTRNAPLRGFLDAASDRGGVGVVSQLEHSEEDELLEVAEAGWWHIGVYDIDTDAGRQVPGASAHPPAIAPTTMKGSAPFATGSGKGVSRSSWERSCSHAKKRKNARRSCVM